MMLAELDHFPPTLPPGFEFVEGEPEFDPALHLALEAPERIVTLDELGYSEEEIGHFPSPIGATSRVRILSEEGVAALQKAIDLTAPRTVKSPAGDTRLYFGSYHSRFMRDLTFSHELTEFLSDIFQAPIAAHTMGGVGVQLNVGETPNAEILGWHEDRVSFTAVISMFNPSAVEGGRFEFFLGTRHEARDLPTADGELPADRVMAPDCPAGYAALIQGTAVYHRAAPLTSPGYRASFLLSFCHRDVSYPDMNGDQTYLTDQRDRLGVDTDIDPSFTEAARHSAWLAQARLGTILEELPWTNDAEFVVAQLREAIAPVQKTMRTLERGRISHEEWRRLRNTGYRERENQDQMSTPRFAPASAPVQAT